MPEPANLPDIAYLEVEETGTPLRVERSRGWLPRVAFFCTKVRFMAKIAKLTRMVLPNHECPYGVQAKQLLENAGYSVDEHILRTRDEVDEYLAELGVDTTPQVFIDDKWIGGSRDLERFLASSKAA